MKSHRTSSGILMERLAPLICGCAICTSVGGCASSRVAVVKNWLQQPSDRVAVIPFRGEEPLGDIFTDALVAELINSGFSVMERSELMRIIKEQTLQYTGAIDPLTASKMGQLAGVDFVVLGYVTTRPVVPLLEWLLGDGEEETQIDNVSLRWVNVQTGQIAVCASVHNSREGTAETIARRITQLLDKKIQTIARALEHDHFSHAGAAYVYKAR